MQLLARTLRYLASTFLADRDPDCAVRAQPNQHTARTNAAEASAILQQQRVERDEIDAYLQSRLLHRGTVNAATGREGHETHRAL